MAACLQCGKKYESNYLLWKGGASRSLCTKCQAAELHKEIKNEDKKDKNHQPIK